MTESSDRALLDVIRRRGPITVEDMASEIGVTANAVRNRLQRLVQDGLVEREVSHGGRGRPRHSYRASAKAQRGLGQNYSDLARVLWSELMESVPDAKLRVEVFRRVIDRLAESYRSRVRENRLDRRMEELGHLLHDQGIEVEVARGDAAGDAPELPILRQLSCPYHDLAESDRSICALERKMFEKVLGHGLRLSQCRLDGHRSCDFEPKTGPRIDSGRTGTGAGSPA